MIWVSLIPPLPLLTLSYFLESNHPLEIIKSSTTPTWLAVLYVGFISTLLAYIIWGKLLKNYTAAIVTPFALLIPVVGVITSNIVLGEQLNVVEVIGGILIMLGLVLCVLGKRLLIFVVSCYHKAMQRTN